MENTSDIQVSTDNNQDRTDNTAPALVEVEPIEPKKEVHWKNISTDVVALMTDVHDKENLHYSEALDETSEPRETATMQPPVDEIDGEEIGHSVNEAFARLTSAPVLHGGPQSVIQRKEHVLEPAVRSKPAASSVQKQRRVVQRKPDAEINDSNNDDEPKVTKMRIDLRKNPRRKRNVQVPVAQESPVRERTAVSLNKTLDDSSCSGNCSGHKTEQLLSTLISMMEQLKKSSQPVIVNHNHYYGKQ